MVKKMNKIKDLILKLVDKLWEILSKYLGSKEPRFIEVGTTAVEDTRPTRQQITDAVIVEAEVKAFEEMDGCCGEDCNCDGSCGDNCKCKEDKACVCGDKDCEAKEAKIVVKRKTKMRKVYHVVPAPEKGWLVKEEKNKNPSARADRKADAVKRAKELAKKAKLGQVIVHKKNGQIQTEYTYGDDPRSTKG